MKSIQGSSQSAMKNEILNNDCAQSLKLCAVLCCFLFRLYSVVACLHLSVHSIVERLSDEINHRQREKSRATCKHTIISVIVVAGVVVVTASELACISRQK